MAVRATSRLRDFAKMHPETEAVIQHVGRETWDLVLIDPGGTWVRDVYAAAEDAEEACRDLGVRAHRGWEDPRMARRMNSRDHWNGADGQKRAL